ncbi:YbaB/EbfC family nucleoid-associated protein [Kibdelosporangium aridum]|uniref:YbaB/EbfC DNA-binding family protein n=1 Tax=Kibdelosporangium aridum TaxID=2030 RepID=A0A1W2B004_KIBAR|nr:YbaB/EbfC family nucleoid-associated protein [Kibdelosporangium aridum]SMC66120.1 YbaB/EbfC DNA-binding family protein [Kibdelosporangium aridum]
MSDRLKEVRVSASDPNGLAEVTVDSTGGLVDIRFNDRMLRSTPGAMAQAVMAALTAAKEQIAGGSPVCWKAGTPGRTS